MHAPRWLGRAPRLQVLAALTVLPWLTGCLAATATMAGVPVAGQVLTKRSIARQTRTDAITTAARPMLDPGARWQRRWESADGQPLTPEGAAAQPGVVRVVWTLPFGVNEGVGAVAVLEEGTCAASAPVVAVSAAPLGAPLARSEVLMFAPLPSVLPDGVRGAVADAERLRVAGEVAMSVGRPRWVVTTPVAGAYRLDLAWTGESVAELEGQRPCVLGWRGIADSVWTATRRVPAVPSAAPRERSERAADPASRAPLQSLEAVVADTGGSAVGAIGGGDAGAPLGAAPSVWGLVEAHEHALEVGLGARPLSVAQQTHDAAVRTALLGQLARNETLAAEICRLTRRYQLDQRALPYWGGQPTVPPQALAGRCSAAGAWLPAPPRRR